jgi:transcriptional regulator with XRE-family HTH domain
VTLDDDAPVVPDGLGVRRRRRARGWSRHALSDAVRRASLTATGVPETLSPDLIRGIEERSEPVPYATLCLLAGGLDCNPVELLGPEAEPEGDEPTSDG